MALQGERALNRWEQLQRGEEEPVGGVWKLIFPPQKPQSRRDEALNPQGPLGGAQRFPQLARSPPWGSRSRCPCPSHPGYCPVRGACGTRVGNPKRGLPGLERLGASTTLSPERPLAPGGGTQCQGLPSREPRPSAAPSSPPGLSARLKGSSQDPRPQVLPHLHFQIKSR